MTAASPDPAGHFLPGKFIVIDLPQLRQRAG